MWGRHAGFRGAGTWNRARSPARTDAATIESAVSLLSTVVSTTSPRRSTRPLQSSDFTPITIFNPIDGTPITYYNISAAANARASNNVTVVEPTRTSTYDAVSVDFRMRLPGGGQLFGGDLVGAPAQRGCDTSSPGRDVDPNSLRFCDDTQNGIPFINDFRAVGFVPSPVG